MVVIPFGNINLKIVNPIANQSHVEDTRKIPGTFQKMKLSTIPQACSLVILVTYVIFHDGWWGEYKFPHFTQETTDWERTFTPLHTWVCLKSSLFTGGSWRSGFQPNSSYLFEILTLRPPSDLPTLGWVMWPSHICPSQPSRLYKVWEQLLYPNPNPNPLYSKAPRCWAQWNPTLVPG